MTYFGDVIQLIKRSYHDQRQYIDNRLPRFVKASLDNICTSAVRSGIVLYYFFLNPYYQVEFYSGFLQQMHDKV